MLSPQIIREQFCTEPGALLNYSYHDITQETVETALLHLPVPVREGEELLAPPWTLISVMNIFKDVPLHLCLF